MWAGERRGKRYRFARCRCGKEHGVLSFLNDSTTAALGMASTDRMVLDHWRKTNLSRTRNCRLANAQVTWPARHDDTVLQQSPVIDPHRGLRYRHQLHLDLNLIDASSIGAGFYRVDYDSLGRAQTSRSPDAAPGRFWNAHGLEVVRANDV